MLHSRWLAWTGIALGALAPLTGCFTNEQNGNPGAAFASGGGTYPPHEGTRSGAAGTSGGHDGGATDAPRVDARAAGDAPAESKPAACAAGAAAAFSVTWSLEDAAGADSSCDGVAGKTVDLDVLNLTTGALASSTTACAALAATTCAMPAGSYALSMKLHDADGRTLAEVFAPTLFLAADQNTVLPSLPFRVGGPDAAKGRGFALTWSLDRKSTGAILSCAQAGATKVRLTAGATTFDLTCADGKGRTTPIAPGSYPVSIALLDVSGATLSETQTMTVPIGARQLVFLGDVPFDVN